MPFSTTCDYNLKELTKGNHKFLKASAFRVHIIWQLWLQYQKAFIEIINLCKPTLDFLLKTSKHLFLQHFLIFNLGFTSFYVCTKRFRILFSIAKIHISHVINSYEMKKKTLWRSYEINCLTDEIFCDVKNFDAYLKLKKININMVQSN